MKYTVPGNPGNPLAGADGAEGDDLGSLVPGNVGDGDGFLVDIQTDEECVRMVHG